MELCLHGATSLKLMPDIHWKGKPTNNVGSYIKLYLRYKINFTKYFVYKNINNVGS